MSQGTQSNIEDRQLVKEALASEAGFEKLVKLHLPMMQVLARSMVQDNADDVVQEAWISIYRNLAKFEFRSSIKTWIYTIVSNTAKTKLRKDKNKRNIEIDENLLSDRFNEDGMWANPIQPWHEDTPDAMLSNQQLQDCIKHFIEQLKPLPQAVLTMKEINQLSLDDICNILDISTSNVRVLLHRGRQAVFSHINHYQETGEC